MFQTKKEMVSPPLAAAKVFTYQFGSFVSIIYMAIRVSTANLSPITDCDEVFNYWEPLHFILYGS
jgi:hypothetical protein